MLPEKGYKRVIVICFYIAITVLCLYLLFNYVIAWIWPVAVAALIGIILQPIIRFMHKKLKFPNKLAAVISVILLYILVGVLVFAIVHKVFSEVSALGSSIPSYIQRLNIDIPRLKEYLNGISDKLNIGIQDGFLDGVFSNLSNSLISMLTSLSSSIISKMPVFITKTAQFVPATLLAVVIMIIATVYFASDYDKIKAFFKLQFSETMQNKLTTIKEHFIETVAKYLRAYLLIMSITAAEIYLGLSIIGQNYSLLIALGIAIIDVLPVLGAGTVLIPWGIILLIIGNIPKGIEILALYLVITVIRQIIEPKIVGEYIGLYPLITLVAMYTGLRIMGIVGMFMFPITIIILKNLNQNGSVHIWKDFPDTDDRKKSTKEKIVEKFTAKKYKAEVHDSENKKGQE